jgi:hypothetical protein
MSGRIPSDAVLREQRRRAELGSACFWTNKSVQDFEPVKLVFQFLGEEQAKVTFVVHKDWHLRSTIEEDGAVSLVYEKKF